MYWAPGGSHQLSDRCDLVAVDVQHRLPVKHRLAEAMFESREVCAPRWDTLMGRPGSQKALQPSWVLSDFIVSFG